MTDLDTRIAALEVLDKERWHGDWLYDHNYTIGILVDGEWTHCLCQLPAGITFRKPLAKEYSSMEFIAAAPEMMSVIRELKAERDASIGVMRELVIALDGAFISSWQSTAAWKKQLDAAIDFLKEKL